MVFPRVDEPTGTLARSLADARCLELQGTQQKRMRHGAMGTVVAIDDRFRVSIGVGGEAGGLFQAALREGLLAAFDATSV
jgi:hypothetical protein